ncbi:PHP domain-containing protein [Anaerosinus sp.]
MKDILDMHTHTIASGHAYNTIREMALAAKAKGLELLGIAEHAPNMPGTCHPFYFYNLEVIDRNAYGIELFLGAELNILDEQGNIDLPEELLSRIDYAIASFHEMCCPPTNKELNTKAMINAMKNPYVNIIGHPDNGNYELDYEAVVIAAKKYKVLLEINNSSMRPTSNRPGAIENNRKMLTLCQKHNVSVILDSDAHSEMGVGNHQYAWQLIEELNFPQELIVNDSREKLMRFLKKRG